MPFAKTAPQRVQPMAMQSLATPKWSSLPSLPRQRISCAAPLSPQDTGSHKLRHGVRCRGSGPAEITGGFSKNNAHKSPGLHHRIDGGVSLISHRLAAPRAGLRGGGWGGGGAWPCLQHTGDITELRGAFGLAETLEGIVHFYFIRQG